MTAPANPGLIRLGVSSCLIGQEVRFDGGHKRNPFLLNVLDPYVEWVPVCPQIEGGMGVPRETIRLDGKPESPRLVAPRSGLDHTDSMTTWAEGRLDGLAQQALDGYILKKDSPSCGLMRVRIYDPETGIPSRDGQGLFARSLVARWPHMPVEEEGRLNDPTLRGNFIERLFAYRRLQEVLSKGSDSGALVEYHTTIKMTLLSHSPGHYRKLGQLVAQAGSLPWESLTDRYVALLMEGLKILTTPGKHVNVIMHLMGFLKDQITAGDKAELLEVLDSYRYRLIPLIVPITLLRHHLKRSAAPDWAEKQVYLNPYPEELMLRNHV